MIDFQPLISVNGRINAAISAFDRGFSYGDGLFETVMLHRGVLPYRDYHQERLLADAEKLHITIPAALLNNYVNHLLDIAKDKKIADGVIKIVVTRGESGRGYQPSLLRPPTIVVQLHPFPLFPERYYTAGVDVFVCRHRLPINERLAGIKHLNKLDYVLASLEWQGTDFHEALLFDADNYLIEANSRNVFVLKGNQLLTPSLKTAGVAGVMRRIIIETMASALSLTVDESRLTLADVLNADEVFLCNSIAGIWPVKSIMGETHFPEKIPEHSIAKQLQALVASDLQRRVEHCVA